METRTYRYSEDDGGPLKGPELCELVADAPPVVGEGKKSEPLLLPSSVLLEDAGGVVDDAVVDGDREVVADDDLDEEDMVVAREKLSAEDDDRRIRGTGSAFTVEVAGSARASRTSDVLRSPQPPARSATTVFASGAARPSLVHPCLHSLVDLHERDSQTRPAGLAYLSEGTLRTIWLHCTPDHHS
ncbi:hypothetical protein BV20DRAFT_99455 [Pilatotrama ljubarskyi]|nr:hypothetical protein BV20DRAFT_99455 [Pilatotrama ljubarskyi]